jgi:hypothetical protein
VRRFIYRGHKFEVLRSKPPDGIYPYGLYVEVSGPAVNKTFGPFNTMAQVNEWKTELVPTEKANPQEWRRNYPESKYWMTVVERDGERYDAFAGNFQRAEVVGKGLESYGYPVSLRPLGDTYKGKKGFKYEKFRRHFIDGRRHNPEDAARELSERFHGMPSDTTTVIETLVHVHEHKTELGDLTEMKLITLNGAARDMTIKFKADLPKLGSNENPEDGTQLFVDGGDQELDLDALGFEDEGWRKEAMVIGVLYEITYDTRKAMDGGQIISYFHGLGEEDLKKSRSKPQLGVQPTLIYHPPIEAEGQKFPARLEIAGGRYNLLEAERGIVN